MANAGRRECIPSQAGAANHFLVDFLRGFAEPYASSHDALLFDSNFEVFCEQCTYQAAAVRVVASCGNGSFCAIETS
ncbi:MAG TPA: hypothetical protein VGJ51_13240 [Candidatus Angelobacter sp.]|jgi:hypothetical protein